MHLNVTFIFDDCWTCKAWRAVMAEGPAFFGYLSSPETRAYVCRRIRRDGWLEKHLNPKLK